MTTLMQASRQWATRPNDERYLSLLDMQEFFNTQREQSHETVHPTSRILAVPTDDNKGLTLELGRDGDVFVPTNYAFGQLATLAEAPGAYLRTLPSPIAADCINYGLKFKRKQINDVGVLTQQNGQNMLRAATGPKYGRIWNSDITTALIEQFGDGRTGDFRVPGEFGKQVEITKQNTTLYAGDRDMFVFLADEEHRIEMPNRRNGEAGSLARGFFVWNSEVGSSTFGVASFLFDYVCCNRIVWGAQEFKKVTIRHTASAPDKFLAEIKPALMSYAGSSTASVTQAIEDARKDKLDGDVTAWLAKRFGSRTVTELQAIHQLEEERPIETRWDVVTAMTAKARSINFQDDRVELEREAGKLLDN